MEPVLRRVHSLLRDHLAGRPVVGALFRMPEGRKVVRLAANPEERSRCGVPDVRTPEEVELNRSSIYVVLGRYDGVREALGRLRSGGYEAIWDQSTMEPDNIKPMWKRRVSVVEAIYADLITERMDNRAVLMDERSGWIDFENSIFNTYTENKEEYKSLIREYLKEGWDLNRINPITVSIMLEAISEHHTLGTDKPVLITQSIKTAKNYCGEEDYKIINAILDSYFRGR